MTVTIDQKALNSIIRKLESLDDPKVFRIPMDQSVKHLKRRIEKYPPQQSRPQPFKTDKSRRFFFWALKAGKITVPYKRGGINSETLGRSWTTTISANGRRGEIGTVASYAPLVQDKTRQAAYHRAGGWRTVQDVAKKEESAIVRYFEKAYERVLSK